MSQAPIRRRALIVAFHLPPQRGGSGHLRILALADELLRRGWSVDILTATASAYPEPCDEGLWQLPPACHVIRAPALDVARHLSWRGRYPDLLALPDRWWTWIPGAVRAAVDRARAHPPDVIVSTYPISSAHVIGRAIARRLGRPWVADFRDPMLLPSMPTGTLRRWLWRRIERATVRDASQCVVTDTAALARHAAQHPEHAAKFSVVANGYVDGSFDGLPPAAGGAAPGPLVILHSGTLYPGHRDPSALFEAVQAMVADGEIKRTACRLRFRAAHDGGLLRRLAARHGVEDMVEDAPPVGHREALAETVAADLLLLLQGSEFNAQIPVKLYEYLRAGQRILALVDPHGASARVLKEHPSSLLVDMRDPVQIRAALRRWLAEHGRPSTVAALTHDAQRARQYARSAQSRIFVDVIEKAIQSAHAAQHAPQVATPANSPARQGVPAAEHGRGRPASPEAGRSRRAPPGGEGKPPQVEAERATARDG